MNRSSITLIAGCTMVAMGVFISVPQRSDAQTDATKFAYLNRINAAYRGMQTFHDEAILSRKSGKDQVTAEVTTDVQRPGNYRLDIKGDRANTVVLSDGHNLIAYRPDRKSYTKSTAPQLLMKSDMLAGVDMPSPGARIISVLLAANLREPTSELGKQMMAGKLTAGWAFEGKKTHVLSFEYEPGITANVTFSDDDSLLRKVILVDSNKETIATEVHKSVLTNGTIASSVFKLELPAGVLHVSALPKLASIEVVEAGNAGDFTAEGADGHTLKLSDYRGKIVVLDLWATWCVPCQQSMPHVEEVYQKVKGGNVVVIGLCVFDKKSDYNQWLPEHANDYHFKFAFDPAGRSKSSIATVNYGVDAIPTTLIIDKNGNVANKIVGFIEGDTRIEDALKKLGVR